MTFSRQPRVAPSLLGALAGALAALATLAAARADANVVSGRTRRSTAGLSGRRAHPHRSTPAWRWRAAPRRLPAHPRDRARRILVARAGSVRTAVGAPGGRIVYRAVSGFGVTDVQGAAHALGDATSRPALDGGIAFDGHTVWGVQSRCDGDVIVRFDAGVAAQGRPPQPMATREPCVVRRAGPGRLRVARDGRAKLRLRCPASCAATFGLVQQRAGRAERLAGSDTFDVPAARGGTLTLTVRIAGYARALAGCRGGLLVQAVLWPFKVHSRGLGSYRLVSRDRCRRAGGPRFEVAREPRA